MIYLYLVNETATHKFFTFYLELFTGENLVYVKIQIIVNVLISMSYACPVKFFFICFYWLFSMNEIKIVSYSFSSSVIEYNSNEKLLKA